MSKPDIFAFGRPSWRIKEYERDGVTYRQNQSITFGFYSNIGEPYTDRKIHGTTIFQMRKEIVDQMIEEDRNYASRGPKKNERIVK